MGYSVSFEHHRANVTLDVWDDTLTGSIELVSSKYKKRYLATYAMKKALQYADFLDLELILEVNPFGSEGHGMDSAELRAWYMTFGFVYEGDGVMARPRKSIPDPAGTEQP